MQLPAGTDRRIIRAFYTQYVAVLLIVLTFTIGAFQRSSISKAGPLVTNALKTTAHVGSVTIQGAFTADGALQPDNQQLEAVVKVLENHDLTASVALSTPRIDFDERASSLRRAIRKLSALERFFEHRSIPASALKFVAQGSSDNTDTVTVRLYPERRAN